MRKAFLGERIREWFCAQEKLCAESFPVRNRLEQTGCYSSPETSERYDPDKKSQRTLVNFVDNRQFLCYNKPATWKKVFFLCLKLLKYEQQKQGRNEETAADPQGSQAITQIHSGGGSRARKITLACTECKQRNYNMTKEKKNHPERMETKKYCRFCKKHTMHKETK